MPLSTTPERAPGGLCWGDPGLRDAAQGRQELLGHSHSLFHAQGIPGSTRSGAVAVGLWLSSRETRLCPGGQAAASVPLCWPSHAWEAFPRCQQSCRAQLGEITAAPSFQGLFSCPACGSSAQVLLGDPSECLVSAVCSSQSSVCSVPAAILCCCQQHLNLPNCCKPPLQL